MGKVVIFFELAGMTHKEYDAAMNELKAQGKTLNENRLAHIAFNKDGKWCVVDVWDSAEAFTEFASTVLAPAFSKLGLTPPQPGVYPLHNYIGKKAEDLISA
jgi:hypothetical protein